MKRLWLKLKLPPLRPEAPRRRHSASGRVAQTDTRRNIGALAALLGCTLLVSCQTRSPWIANGYDASNLPAGLSSSAIDHIAAMSLQVRPAVDAAGQRGYLLASGPYRIFTTVRSALQQRLIALVLREGWEQFNRLLPSARPRLPLHGYIFARRHQWMVFTRYTLQASATYYDAPGIMGYDHDGVFALFRTTVPMMLSVAAHEAWLQFSYVSLKDHLPAWMDEGLATQFEAVCWQHGRPVFRMALNYPRWLAVRAMCRNDRFIPLHIFTRISAGAAVASGPRMTEIYYGELWSFMLFLTAHDGWATIQRVLRSARGGSVTPALLSAGLTPEDLRRQSVRWNLIAGPLFFHRFISPHTNQTFSEYKHFARKLSAHWPPRISVPVIAR
jgi:hypothetical protein